MTNPTKADSHSHTGGVERRATELLAFIDAYRDCHDSACPTALHIRARFPAEKYTLASIHSWLLFLEKQGSIDLIRSNKAPEVSRRCN